MKVEILSLKCDKIQAQDKWIVREVKSIKIEGWLPTKIKRETCFSSEIEADFYIINNQHLQEAA